MKKHILNSRKYNSINWSEQTNKGGFDYSGPIAVIKSFTDIDFDHSPWDEGMPKHILGFLPTEVNDKIEEILEHAHHGTVTEVPWDFISASDLKYVKSYFSAEAWEPKYFDIKGKDGKYYFIADIITEDAWNKFIAKYPEFAKYKMEQFTPGYATNSRLHRLNSRKLNSDVLVAEVWSDGRYHTVEDSYFMEESEVSKFEKKIFDWANEHPDPEAMDFVGLYTFENTDEGIRKFKDYVRKTQGMPAGMDPDIPRKDHQPIAMDMMMYMNSRLHRLNSRESNAKLSDLKGDEDIKLIITDGLPYGYKKYTFKVKAKDVKDFDFGKIVGSSPTLTNKGTLSVGYLSEIPSNVLSKFKSNLVEVKEKKVGGSWIKSKLENSRKMNSELVSDAEFARIVEESGFQISDPNQFRGQVSDINLSNAEKEYWDTRDWIQSGNVHGSQLGFEQIRLKYAKKLMELAKSKNSRNRNSAPDPNTVNFGIQILEEAESTHEPYDPIELLMSKLGCTQDEAIYIARLF